ncbi:acyl-CoA dehydrogenase family protein [Novosphingobium profundi]|uniref:acyl-CoA dehydrogenase family protein n=1 Tax=Novosphingobium profundi TaxID=1774954 RepID=UPI001BD916FA|nr:acyl-CoA dehydrogenase family protein [Novosphingobium profundi]MBT0668595.1 acyl-CoA dehydrogenase family protein [Novosphingobium profundi]
MTDPFCLTEDQVAIRDMAEKFTADRITPYAAHWDETSHYPVEVWKAAGELGLGAIYVSEEGGGIGLGRLEAALAMEAMAYGCPATSAYISIHNMVAWMVDSFADESLKARYLPGLVAMDTIGSYCLTEPSSGSDAAALRTTARREGDGYFLNGTKQFISGGGVNDVYLVMARTGDHKTRGISCFLLEKGMEGLSFGAPERKLGWNASPTAQVILEECRVPEANRVGAEGDGFRFAMAGLDGGRLNIGACSLGGAQRCLDEAIAYVKERRQFDQPLAEFQNTQFRLADMAAELEAARALLYLAASKVTAGSPDKTRFAAMAKMIASDTGSSVVDRALQLFGGYGYLRDYPIERFWRDLRVHRILEGTNEVMRMIIGRELLK